MSFSASVVDVCLFILTLQEKHSATFKALAGKIVAFVGRDMNVKISVGKKVVSYTQKVAIHT